MAKHETRNQRIGWFLFILYLLVLMHLVFFSEMEERGLLKKDESLLLVGFGAGLTAGGVVVFYGGHDEDTQ